MELPNSIGQLKRLKKLYIYMKNGETQLPESIGDLQSLEKLTIKGDSVDRVQRLPETINQLRSLRQLELQCFHLPGDMGHLKSSLENLRINWPTQFPDGIFQLENLKTLTICIEPDRSPLVLSDDTIERLSQLKLEKIDIQGYELSDGRVVKINT